MSRDGCDEKVSDIPWCNECIVVLCSLDHRVKPVRCRSVQILRLVDFMQNRTEDKRRIDHSEIKLDLVLVLLHEIPCGTLSQHLTGAIFGWRRCVPSFLLDLLRSTKVPILLAERPRFGVVVEDGGARRSDHDAFHVRAVLQSTREYTTSAVYSRNYQFVGIVGLEVEGRRGVLNRIDALDSFVEGAILSDSTLSVQEARRWPETYLCDVLYNN